MVSQMKMDGSYEVYTIHLLLDVASLSGILVAQAISLLWKDVFWWWLGGNFGVQ